MYQVARELNISPKTVELIYKSYWKFIKESIANLDLENMQEEDFDNTDTNFSIPRIGKLHTNFKKVQKQKRRLKYLENNVKIKRDKTDVQPGSCD